MKDWATVVALLTALSASIALADDFKTVNGKEYKNATVTRVESDGIIIRTAGGISKIYFTELPKDVADKWLAPIRAAERAAEDDRMKEQRSAEEKRAAAERERAETDKVADADLKQSLEQFQAAEQRATQDYRSATKGMLSGQVFVSTKGGENFKLGAVQVALFSRNGIDAFIKATKTYAEIKIQELNTSVRNALAANRAGAEYRRGRESRDLYYTGCFLFWAFATSDSDGGDRRRRKVRHRSSAAGRVRYRRSGPAQRKGFNGALLLVAAGVTRGSATIHSKFVEQQSHKHNGNIFLNTHQGY